MGGVRKCGWDGCGKSLSGCIPSQRYCDNTCQGKAKNARRREQTIEKLKVRICSECQETIPINYGNGKTNTCSKECSKNRRKLLHQLNTPCQITNCNETSAAITGRYAGLCPTHAWRKKNGKDLYGFIKKWKNRHECSYPTCHRTVHSMAFCGTHYDMARKGEELRDLAGSREEMRKKHFFKNRPIGSRSKTRDGYIRVSTESGWRMEHIVVMEQYIGRPLLPHESVHHMNGCKEDNKITNLELWSKSQPSGQRVKDKLNWAREIISLYQDLPLFDSA